MAKSVLPITSRQSGELSRLLEERGVGDGVFQQLIEDPNRLVDFILREYARQFLPKVRQALERAGWEIVQVPGEFLAAPVTLNQLHQARDRFGAEFWTSWHEDFTRGDIEYFPLPAGELAWMPEDPLIPGSAEKSFAEQEKVVANFSRQVQERFRETVEAIFPTVEQAVFLLFNRRRWTGEYVLRDRYTRTVNRFASDRLHVGCFDGSGLRVGDWLLESQPWHLGVLRLVVARQ